MIAAPLPLACFALGRVSHLPLHFASLGPSLDMARGVSNHLMRHIFIFPRSPRNLSDVQSTARMLVAAPPLQTLRSKASPIPLALRAALKIRGELARCSGATGRLSEYAGASGTATIIEAERSWHMCSNR